MWGSAFSDSSVKTRDVGHGTSPASIVPDHCIEVRSLYSGSSDIREEISIVAHHLSAARTEVSSSECSGDEDYTALSGKLVGMVDI